MATRKSNVEDIFGLSPMQEGILFHTIHAPQSGLYVEQFACTLTGALDAPLFEAAWAHVVSRHTALRTLFTWEKRDRPLQVVRASVTIPWRHEDWRADGASGHDDRVRAFLRLDREAGIALDRAPLLRFALFRTSDDEHRFVWTFHHLLLDGWSMRLVLREALDAYQSLLEGRALPTHRARPFREFVTWLDARDTSGAEPYWREALRGFETPTPLVAGRADDHRRWAERHDTVNLALTREATRTLTAAARGNRLTLNTFLRGAWALYLARTSGESDVVFGATVSGRSPELDGVDERVGLFINSIPARVRVPEDERVTTWLESIQRDQFDASAHDSVPLTDIQRWSDVGGAPLFQSLLVVENHPADPAGRTPRLAMSNADYVEQSNFPLALLAVPGDTLDVIFVYDRDRFDRTSMQAVAAQYETALVSLANAPAGRVGDVSLLPEDEMRRVLVDFNDTHRDLDADACIHHLIREQAIRAPEAVAVRFEGASLTYRDLMARADALAAHLETMGVGPGRSVAIGVDRSLEMIVAILGVLEAGAAYVPFTPDQPIERTRHLLDDTEALVVLSAGPHFENLRSALSVGPTSVLSLDEDYPAAPHRSSPAGPDDTAYTIYTSGSTGTPKGVDVTHRALVHSTRARSVTYPEVVSAFCLLSPFVFDSSVAGIFWTLTTGGILVLPSLRMEQDIPSLTRLLRDERVSHYLGLPVVHGLVLEHADPADLAALETVVLAGEACPSEVVRAHFDRLPRVSLYNEYGPTEVTVWSTVHRMIPSDADDGVPIGRPIANAQVYILDSRSRPVPPGVPGELCIGGAGLARGYRNRPDDTSRKFVQVSLGGREVRIYRTGDRARFRADGVVDFLGRMDHQIKIRGHRIELGEIESHLRREPAVRDAVVVAVEEGGRASLVAYVEGSAETTEASLRAGLSAALPEYMVPARVCVLETLPRTATGKISREALPAPAPIVSDHAAEAYQAPRNPGEERLSVLWADVLGRDQVGIHDNFFELGGDSILSIRIIARAREAGFRISPQEFFDYPTVAGLAAVATPSNDGGAVRTTAAEGPVPLTPVQHWFFESVDTDPHHWNQAARLDVPPGIELHHLIPALAALVEHHDALRLRFRRSESDWNQELRESAEEALVREVDVTDAANPSIAVDAAEAALHATLSLENPPLVRAVLCRTPADRRDQLVLAIHHLAVDAVSWPILIEDLETACRQIRARETIHLAAPTTPFSVWAARQTERANSPEIDGQRAYWLASVPEVSSPVPRDGAAVDRNTWGNSETTTSSLTVAETDTLLREAAATYRMRVNEFLLCALALAFREWTGSARVLVDTEGHGRDHGFDDVDVTRTVGWFTTVFPIQLQLPDDDTPEANLIAIKECVRAIPDFGVGFGLLRYLNSDESLRAAPCRLPAAEVAFNYLGQRGFRVRTHRPAARAPHARTSSRSTPPSLRVRFRSTGPTARPCIGRKR
jgi:amino acid adenylation domain-containing protein